MGIILKKYRRAFIILLLIAFADIAIRFSFNFDTNRILLSEAFLFLLASAFMLWAAKCDKVESIRVQHFDLWVALFLALGGIRAAVWALGNSVLAANVFILALGLVFGVLLYRWSRKRN